MHSYTKYVATGLVASAIYSAPFQLGKKSLSPGNLGNHAASSYFKAMEGVFRVG